MEVHMKVVTALFALALAGSAGACSRGIVHDVQGVSITEEKPGLMQQAKLTPDSAMKIAAARVPGGHVVKGELEEEDGRLIYSLDVKVDRKNGIEEVWVDARTGEVVSVKHEG
jgi:uncharacterized membrane protein YkoI